MRDPIYDQPENRGNIRRLSCEKHETLSGRARAREASCQGRFDREKELENHAGLPGRRAVAAGLGRMVEVNTLMDDEGNLAQQIDSEGFRYRFNGSDLPWSLIVG
jgi:hypothetical protein